jgi:hypothetical protein
LRKDAKWHAACPLRTRRHCFKPKDDELEKLEKKDFKMLEKLF